MTGSGTTSAKFIRIYRNEPDFGDYLKARFGSTDQSRDVFEYRGAKYRFTHSSTDAQGMFDVLELVDSPASDTPQARG
jgi:hypothetical protein